MQDKGIQNNAASSMVVPEGCQVTLYSDNNYNGAATVYTPGKYTQNANDGSRRLNHNDDTSSLIVEDYGDRGALVGYFDNDGTRIAENSDVLRTAISTPFYYLMSKRLSLVGTLNVTMKMTGATSDSLQAASSMDQAGKLAMAAANVQAQTSAVVYDDAYSQDGRDFMRLLQPAVTCAMSQLNQMYTFYSTKVVMTMYAAAAEHESSSDTAQAETYECLDKSIWESTAGYNGETTTQEQACESIGRAWAGPGGQAGLCGECWCCQLKGEYFVPSPPPTPAMAWLHGKTVSISSVQYPGQNFDAGHNGIYITSGTPATDPYQQWKLMQLSNGYWSISSVQYPGQNFDAGHNGIYITTGTPATDPYQQWKLTQLSNGYWSISSVQYPGQNFDAGNNGIYITTGTPATDPYQQWKIKTLNPVR